MSDNQNLPDILIFDLLYNVLSITGVADTDRYQSILQDALHLSFQQYQRGQDLGSLGNREEPLVRVVELLLGEGVCVNSRGPGGRTALVWAVELGLVGVLRVLVRQRGLDTGVRWVERGQETDLYRSYSLQLCLAQSSVALFHLVCAPISLLPLYRALTVGPGQGWWLSLAPTLLLVTWAGLGEPTFTSHDMDPASFRSYQLTAFKTLLRQECCPLEEGVEIIFSTNPQYPLNRCMVWDRRATFHQTRGALMYCTPHFLSLRVLARAAVRTALGRGQAHRSLLPSLRAMARGNTLPRPLLRDVFMFSQAMEAFPRTSNDILELFKEELEVNYCILPKV